MVRKTENGQDLVGERQKWRPGIVIVEHHLGRRWQCRTTLYMYCDCHLSPSVCVCICVEMYVPVCLFYSYVSPICASTSVHK